MIKPNTQLTNFTPADANYPYGSGKDETAPGSNDGSEYKKIRADDIFGMQQAILRAAGLVPSGNAETVVNSQFMEALLHQVTAGAHFIDSGAADAYDLNHATNGYAPAAYKDGAFFRFTPDNTNTGASTVDIDGLGAKDIKTPAGADPAAGAIQASLPVTLQYILASDYFIIYSVATGGVGGDAFTGDNAIINPVGVVPQRADYTLVKDAYDFGKCDRFEGMATGTTVDAGVLTQTTTANVGITGFAHKFSAVTVTGTGVIYHRTRIESKDAKAFKNQLASLGVKVYHDKGSAITYTLFVRKANAEDNFAAVTEISNDGGTSVLNTTSTELKFEGVSMGDCSNGIEVELKIECGAITTKSFEQTEYLLVPSESLPVFSNRPIEQEVASCQRYFSKSYNIDEAPGAVTNSGGITESATRNDAVAAVGARLPASMREVPTITLYSHSNGTPGKVDNAGEKAAALVGIGVSGFMRIDITGGTTASCNYHFTADAEL